MGYVNYARRPTTDEPLLTRKIQGAKNNPPDFRPKNPNVVAGIDCASFKRARSEIDGKKKINEKSQRRKFYRKNNVRGDKDDDEVIIGRIDVVVSDGSYAVRGDVYYYAVRPRLTSESRFRHCAMAGAGRGGVARPRLRWTWRGTGGPPRTVFRLGQCLLVCARPLTAECRCFQNGVVIKIKISCDPLLIPSSFILFRVFP